MPTTEETQALLECTARSSAVKYANRFPPLRRLEAAERWLEQWSRNMVAGKRMRIVHYGIEHIGVWEKELSYLNTGETYDATICQEDRGELFVGSWGDWVEGEEEKFEEETDTIRCGFCGKNTPRNHKWSDTVCDHCNNLVGG